MKVKLIGVTSYATLVKTFNLNVKRSDVVNLKYNVEKYNMHI